MSFKRCPGSMAFAQPKIELVRCPTCGDDAEVWTDEAEGKCAKCGGTVCRTTTQSCIDWCKYARDCLGDEAHKKYQDMKTRLRKESLLKAAEAHLTDERHRQLARDRVGFAEQILRREEAADPNVVLASSALLGAGSSGPESRDTAATATASREYEPTPAAAAILHELGYPEGFIKEVCAILLHLGRAETSDGINFRIVHDADLLANDAAGRGGDGMDRAQATVPERYLTATGRSLATQAMASGPARKI